MFSRSLKKNLALAAALPVALVATLGSGTAKAAQLTCNLTDFSGCVGTLGDKSFSGFSFSPTGWTPLATDTVVVDQTGGIYQVYFNAITASTNFSGTFGYTVAITPAGVSAGNTFGSGQVNLTGSTLSGGTIASTVTSAGLSGPASSTGGPGPGVAFNSGVTTAAFSQTFSVTSPATLNQVGFSFTQSNPSSVPGPLPVLGAGAAFGFSRKLRKRIKQAA